MPFHIFPLFTHFHSCFSTDRIGNHTPHSRLSDPYIALSVPSLLSNSACKRQGDRFPYRPIALPFANRPLHFTRIQPSHPFRPSMPPLFSALRISFLDWEHGNHLCISFARLAVPFSAASNSGIDNIPGSAILSLTQSFLCHPLREA